MTVLTACLTVVVDGDFYAKYRKQPNTSAMSKQLFLQWLFSTKCLEDISEKLYVRLKVSPTCSEEDFQPCNIWGLHLVYLPLRVISANIFYRNAYRQAS